MALRCYTQKEKEKVDKRNFQCSTFNITASSESLEMIALRSRSWVIDLIIKKENKRILIP